MHPYHVIKSICEDHDLAVKPMAGANENNATFVIRVDSETLYGVCRGNHVILNLGDRAKVAVYDLHQPESISKITEHILSVFNIC
jgi:hypothetical protein